MLRYLGVGFYSIYQTVLLFPFGEDVLDWVGPSGEFMKYIASIPFLWPNSITWDASIQEAEHRVLFVANHAILGFDLPLMVAAIYQKTGRLPRGLGDRSHFFWPGIRQLLQFFGVVLGSREVCTRLMQDGQPLLVFPGGGREVMKRKGDALYELFWGDKIGFAELVLKHNYSIIPVASVGSEDSVKIIFDLPVSPILRMIGDKRGVEGFSVPVVVPKTSPQKFYISFGEIIRPDAPRRNETHIDNSDGSTATDESKHHDVAENISQAILLRNRAYESVSTQIEILRRKQESDPNRYLFNGALLRTVFWTISILIIGKINKSFGIYSMELC